MLSLRHSHFFSVCDGHGHNGQEVSGLLKHRLPFQIEKHLKEGLAQHSMNEYPDSEIVKTALMKAFEDANKEVYSMVSDVRFSGSTCTSIITYGKKVYCANVGDSRTILIRANTNGEGCLVRALSRDHKPDDPEESKVILANNGRIDSYRDQLGNQIGPMRVWLKTEDIPGLAMSRSFGDAMAARVGVNAIPEIKEFQLTTEDKIMVLASDGVWEFLKN